jgi:hypothetical protein
VIANRPAFFKKINKPSVVGRKPLHLAKPEYLKKLRTKITLPEILIENNIWRGASEIVRIYKGSFTENLSFTNIIPSSNANYCACISYKPTADTIVRYKLWEDVGEILYVPVYNGEFIGANFEIEIWNTPDAILHGGGDSFYTSQLVVPTSICSLDDLELYGTFSLHECIDITFDLTDFVPAAGDYYTIGESGGCDIATLVKATVFGDYFLLQCIEDLTWHKMYVYRDIFGVVTYGIDQANSAAGVKGYVPFIIGTEVRKLNLTLDPFGVYNINLNETVVDPDASASYLVTDPATLFKHAVIATEELTLSFGQVDL